ncbi:glycosyltransferase [Nocardia alba]|uniref:Glycosyltransferase involved in cell wall biosynthesis n=3 Tax=Nocardia alba TaxID=225051 RepID=A0A4R1F1B3_9NOCA|nr:glycosyltransferase [Nocardia alba]TCJ87976.1 glycosyltransferase involved in cell wall biosynthesis [Nocardia alba]
MRFHVVSLPHTQTTIAYQPCAYTQKARRFATMMTEHGHDVILYGGEENDALCAEFVPLVTKAEQAEWFGGNDPTKEISNLTWDPHDHHWRVANARAISEIAARKRERDFIGVLGGCCQQAIADTLPELMTVEFGIGYSGVFAKYRVFESYAWMHSVYGARTTVSDVMSARGEFYDAVIPNYYAVEEFPYSADKDDYFLFIGRLIEAKGIQIAIDTCTRLGVKLIVAGASAGEVPTAECVEYVGVVDSVRRGELMSRARAVFVPTLYLEPFGGVHAEAMLCGTPVITTDWGVFTETVQQGVQGFRCRTLREFCTAAETVDKLDYRAIREYAIGKFSTDAVAPQYETYFERLLDLWDDGWYAR